MAYEPKDFTGSLFKNNKANSANSPQATGSALIDGVEYYVDAWTNMDKNGNRYQSLKFKRKDVARSPQQRQREPERRSEFDDSDVPF